MPSPELASQNWVVRHTSPVAIRKPRGGHRGTKQMGMKRRKTKLLPCDRCKGKRSIKTIKCRYCKVVLCAHYEHLLNRQKGECIFCIAIVTHGEKQLA